MKISLALILTITSTAFSLASCDDGHIDEPTSHTTEEGYNVRITGTFNGLDTWNGNYSVVAAAFGDEDEYSLIQKVLPPSPHESTVSELTLSNVPTNSRTIEIALVNNLRKRIAAIYTYALTDNQHLNDTIIVDAGELDAGMFSTINRFIFQGEGTSCSRCHNDPDAAAHLDLTDENAYSSLVDVSAYKDSTWRRVLPGNAAASFLYKVITTGDDNVSYAHPALFTDERYTPFIDIIATWIDGGAKRY